MNNEPDTMPDAPWHMLQYWALSERQKEELLLALFAAMQANDEFVLKYCGRPTDCGLRNWQAAMNTRHMFTLLFKAAGMTAPQYTREEGKSE